MDQSSPLPFANWQNFYEIVGSSAGALTGVQFVVITLIAQARVSRSMREIRAFGTPTLVHFCSALLVSALVAMPWQSLVHFAVCLGVFGTVGGIYAISIFWHARKADYTPDLEDWVWYTALPLIAHAGLVVAAVQLLWNAVWVPYMIAADTLLFLLLGIHNAWDTVTYIAVKHSNHFGNAEVSRGGTDRN